MEKPRALISSHAGVSTQNPGTRWRHAAKYLACLWVGVWAICLGATAHAQTNLPDPSPELQRQELQRQELRQRLETQPWSPAARPAQTPPHQRLPEEKTCARIEKIQIQGVLFSEKLQTALSGINGDDPPFGRCLGGEGITLLIQRVQQALIEQGYITSHIHVDEQDLKTGTLIFRIDEGRIARIRAKSENIVLPRLAWATYPGKILNLRDIEQSSENLQRLPSLRSQIQIEPGQEPGTSDIVVDLEAGRPLRLMLSADDAGLKTTGKQQGSATLSWDNPLGLSDFFYITKGQDLGDRDAGPRGSRNQIVHYSLPWGYWLLGATFSENEYHQTVYGPYESYLYTGTSRQNELSLSRVIHRDGQSKTTASLKGFTRQSNNYIADLEVEVQRRRTTAWEVGLQHLHYFATGTLTTQFAYRQGTGAFGAQPAPEEIKGQGTGRMRLMTGFLQWVMPFKTDKHPWQYTSQLQWQTAQTRLTPQDRFCLGSRNTVRGFDSQQTICGDEGQTWRQELATALPGQPRHFENIQLFAALDTGSAWIPDQNAAYRLTGVAAGLRGQHKLNDDYPLQWEFFIGKPLAYPEGFTTSRPTTGFNLRAEF